MTKYAILLGAAKTGFQQKKLTQFHDSLVSDGGFSEREIVVFPNGISEILLEYALNNAIEQNNCVEQRNNIRTCYKRYAKKTRGKVVLYSLR